MSGDSYLNLVCGDPSQTPASFTRFVLPFAYHAIPIDKNPENRPYLESTDIPDRANYRKKYFTREIQDVLFREARWLEMDPQHWTSTSRGFAGGVTCTVQKSEKIRLRMLPPRLVLFEWSDAQKKEMDILQTGFLLLDLYFDQPSEWCVAPTLDHLLLINELFRYFDRPYA